MKSTKIEHLLRMASLPTWKRHPPIEFLKEAELQQSSKRMQVAGWKLFKKKKEIPSLQEIQQFLDSRATGNETGTYTVGKINSHFLDSGAFTMWTEASKYAEANKCSKWDYYNTPDFWAYMEAYAEFVIKYKIGIDFFANVDAVPNPIITYRNQKWFEWEKGITPVPVVHYTTDLKWLSKYIEEGYEFIALGGLVGSMMKQDCIKWLDRAFDIICDTKDKLPCVKIHGFGVTNHTLLWRYPWWSVDSTVWTKMGAFGEILVPPYRKGKWIFNKPPFKVAISMDSTPEDHFLRMSTQEQEIVLLWLKHIGMKLGKLNKDHGVEEYGVMTRHTDRRAANLHYFEHMRKDLPEWPWPWKNQKQKGIMSYLLK